MSSFRLVLQFTTQRNTENEKYAATLGIVGFVDL